MNDMSEMHNTVDTADSKVEAKTDTANTQADGIEHESNPWDVDLNDERVWLKIAAERLSIVRYVFLVQVEDGIATAAQRASLEYADAVLIGWPDNDSNEVVDLEEGQRKQVYEQITLMEQYIARFSTMERDHDIDGMTDTLIRVTERVAEVRRAYQPDFPLPTFAEIRRVVQDEWDADMDEIDSRDVDVDAVTDAAADAAGQHDSDSADDSAKQGRNA